MKRAEIRGHIRDVITALPAFSGRDVVLDNGRAAENKQMETAFAAAPGWCVRIPPILRTEFGTSLGNRVVEKAIVAIHIRTNPAFVPADFSVDALVDAVIPAVLESSVRDIGAGDGERVTSWAEEDGGLYTTAILFNVTITT